MYNVIGRAMATGKTCHRIRLAQGLIGVATPYAKLTEETTEAFL